LILTGGQFGKVFVKNLDTKQVTELVDQAQAHKRKIASIKTTIDYIFTVGADQKIKQWSIHTLKLIWSSNWEWIPTHVGIFNDTLVVGGPSVVSTVKLQYLDFSNDENNLKTISTSTPRISNTQNSGKSEESSTFMSIVIIVIVAAFAFCILLYNYLSRRRTDSKETVSGTSSTKKAFSGGENAKSPAQEKSTTYGMISSNILGGATILTSMGVESDSAETLYSNKNGFFSHILL
jgi:preprotein translocase subunit SecG